MIKEMEFEADMNEVAQETEPSPMLHSERLLQHDYDPASINDAEKDYQENKYDYILLADVEEGDKSPTVNVRNNS